MRRAGSALLVFALVGWGAPARGQSADDAKAAARTAYARGEQLARSGDLAGAAIAFDEADRLVPSPVALESAIGAATRSKDALLVMRIVDRASDQGRGDLPFVAAARSAHQDRTARLIVPCVETSQPCVARVDGADLGRASLRLLPGVHRVSVTSAGGARVLDTQLDLRGGESRTLTLPSTSTPATRPVVAPPPTERPAGDGGISPLWLILGGGITAALGATTIATGVLAQGAQSDLDTLQCKEAAPGCVIGSADAQRDVIADGERFETMTYAFGAATGGMAVATALFAAFAVDWTPKVDVSVSSSKIALSFGTSF